MQKIKITGIAAFCLTLVGCFALSCISPQKEYSQAENRALETKPEISLSDIRSGDYQSHYEKYLNDQIFLRDAWVKLAVTMERLIGKQDINNVYIGKDGCLIEKYKESDFNQAQIEENIGILSGFLNDAVRRYGKNNVSCMMLPSKADALPDKLPAYAGTYDKADTVLALEGRLDEPGILLSVDKVLRQHQDEYIFYRTDHHWTTLGAYYAYCAWADLTGHSAKPIGAYRRETVFKDFYGTTYQKAPMDVPMDSVELFHGKGETGIRVIEDDGDIVSDSFYFMEEASRGFNRYNVFFSKNTAKIQVHTKAGTGRRLLLVKDSFANCFVPFLAEDYDEILMVDCRYSKGSIRSVMEEHGKITDVLVMYNLEKFMQETNLNSLEEGAETMEEFNMDDFFGEAF